MKILAGSIVAILLAIILIYSLQYNSQTDQKSPTVISANQMSDSDTALSTESVVISESQSVMQNKMATNSTLEDLKPGYLMEAIDPPENYPEQFDVSENSRFVKFNHAYLTSIRAGDSIEFMIPQSGNVYPVLVENKYIDQLGSTILQGNVIGYEQAHNVIIAQTEQGSIISLVTPEGNFSIESEGNLAIVRPLSDYPNDTSTNDAVSLNPGPTLQTQ